MLRQRTSDLPSPLKSPTPAISQVAVNDADVLACEAAGIVRIPKVGVAVGVAPEDVGLAVAIEVADAGDRARGADADLRRRVQPPTPVPFISQIATAPLALRQRMSDLPSPLKSPTPATCQAVSARPSATLVRPAGAVHQPDRDSAVALRQRMSDLPSPLKSPVPTICQACRRDRGRRGVGPTVAPFISTCARRR